jgi:hypothetical protein
VADLIQGAASVVVVSHFAATPGLALCMVTWDQRTGRSCPERAVYEAVLTGSEKATLFCADHAARWRSAGGVERIATL